MKGKLCALDHCFWSSRSTDANARAEVNRFHPNGIRKSLFDLLQERFRIASIGVHIDFNKGSGGDIVVERDILCPCLLHAESACPIIASDIRDKKGIEKSGHHSVFSLRAVKNGNAHIASEEKTE